jgi:vacuolar-type H+-ATPase subunit I/STV1
MVAERFWAQLEKQTAAEAMRRTERPALPSRMLMPEPDDAANVAGPDQPSPRLPVASQDWSGVLDIINGARAQAEVQKELLRVQAEQLQDTIQELSEEAEAIRQQVRVSEAQAQEAKAEAERRVAEVMTQAEARVRDIQLRADAQIALARKETLRAEERAAVAESWLARIEAAARTLVPPLVALPVRRIA